MDMEVFAQYRVETDERKKRRLADRLLRENMALVNKLVHQLSRRGDHQDWDDNRKISSNGTVGDLEFRREPIDIADLMQAGRIGFMRALEKYDPEKGGIAGYAKHWIRHEIQQCVIHETTIYTPRGSGLPYAAYQKAAAIRTKEGREPTAAELDITEEQHEAWKEMPGIVMSLDETYMHDGELAGAHESGQVDGAVASGLFADDRAGAEELLANAEAATFSVEMLDILTPAERAVIKETYFRDKKPEAVAKLLRQTVEWVKEKLASGLAKLREELDDADPG